MRFKTRREAGELGEVKSCGRGDEMEGGQEMDPACGLVSGATRKQVINTQKRRSVIVLSQVHPFT